jgi:hypothetical protein
LLKLYEDDFNVLDKILQTIVSINADEDGGRLLSKRKFC